MLNKDLDLQNRIWYNISCGVGNHGSFLKAFSEAFLRADNFNKVILLNASQELIFKYKLNKKPYID